MLCGATDSVFERDSRKCQEHQFWMQDRSFSLTRTLASLNASTNEAIRTLNTVWDANSTRGSPKIHVRVWRPNGRDNPEERRADNMDVGSL